jgi:hypothetical protein
LIKYFLIGVARAMASIEACAYIDLNADAGGLLLSNLTIAVLVLVGAFCYLSDIE